MIVRPAQPADLPGIQRLAVASAVGVTSLPAEAAKLEEKIGRSVASFAAGVEGPGPEQYTFVLEDGDGRIVGTSGIVASAGFRDRFYSYRHEIIVHASQELGVRNKIRSLHLCHDLTGHSLLVAFFIDQSLRETPFAPLLSRARLLFMAEHRARFAERVAAEHPGWCDADGHSPFWDAVGRKFFGMEFPQAERLSGGPSKTFIAELMPQYPIYVPLLPPAAREAIGRLHPLAHLPFAILTGEGLEAETYVDIFDGGPTVAAKLSGVKSVAQSRLARVEAGDTEASGRMHLVATTRPEGFRATLAPLTRSKDTVKMPAELAARLDVVTGEAVRMTPL